MFLLTIYMECASQYVFLERILFVWGSNKKEFYMVTKSRMVNRKSLILICFLVIFFVAATVQANQQNEPLKSDVKASVITVNINTATAEQLTVLPGVGSALADRIIKHRTEVGKFNAPSDLMAVKGVGQKKLDKMLNMVVVK